MFRRNPRSALLVLLASSASIALAYGCGDSGDGVPDATDAAAESASSSSGSSGTSSGASGSSGTSSGASGSSGTSSGASGSSGTSGSSGSSGSSGEAGTDAGADADADAEVDAGADAEVDAGFDAEPPPGPLSPTYVDRDINHVLETGQSNSVASGARPFTTLPLNTVAITNTQPFTNIMFNTGVMTSRNCSGNNCPLANYDAVTSFVPLVEGDNYFDINYKVETVNSAMANRISQFATTDFLFGVRPGYPTKHDVLASLHGRSGTKYICLRKTAVPANCGGAQFRMAFAEGVKQMQDAKALADAQGKSYVVRAVTIVHGESDHYGGLGDFPMASSAGVPGAIKDYADAMIELQQDYEEAAKAITGQAEGVPLIMSGLSGWTDVRYSKVAAQQHDAHVRSGGKVILATPAYIVDPGMKTNGDPECLHQSIHGERHLGEYFAKAYRKVVFEGGVYDIVRPTNVTRVGNVVTVTFNVPSPPLVIDNTLVASIASSGFEYRVGGPSGTQINITNVQVTAPDTVTLTLASTPAGANQRLIYGLNEPSPGCIGPGTASAGGARGNLRDSDPTTSRYGFKLYNWAAQFDVPVP